MSHKAGEAEKLISVDNVSVVPAVGSPFSVTKGYTASSPATGGIRYFQLPDPTTVVVGMSYEIKDSNGTAGASAHKIVVMAPGSVQIDGSTDNDEITTAWGAKTYVNMGNHYSVRGIQRHRAATPSGGGAYDQAFSGSADGTALPNPWTSTVTGEAPPWLIQTDTFYSAGPNLSSAGSEFDPDTSNFPSTGMPAVATLSYDAGTLASGSVVTFKWIRDTWDYAASSYNRLRFKVNGLTTENYPNTRQGWLAETYTTPSTGVYVFSWEWTRTYKNTDSNTNNGCFVDEFTIT